MTDEELVQDLLKSEADTYEGKLLSRQIVEQLLGRHYDWVTQLCLSEISDSGVALDCAQEIMIQVAKGLISFRGESKLSTWIYTISKRQIFKSRNRHKKLRSRFLLSKGSRDRGEDSGTLEAISTAPGADELILKDEQQKQLLKLVQRLPQKQRHSIALHYFEDMPVKDIAQRLGCSEATVKTHLHRGRKKLEELVRNE